MGENKGARSHFMGGSGMQGGQERPGMGPYSFFMPPNSFAVHCIANSG